MNALNKYLILGVAVLSVSACGTTKNSRYSQKQDSAPEFKYGVLDLQDVTPRYESYAPANFRPYTVLGKYYTPMLTGKGFEEYGEASWYGQKFHGHLTSNGETYDMFSMTAAHKTLPLPSFVKVTNLDNQKVAIVRVNDRGPFHPGRVIDLSYAAAKKLDVLSTGVANVKVEVVHIDEEGVMTVGAGKPQMPDVPPSLAQPDSAPTLIAKTDHSSSLPKSTHTTMEDRLEEELSNSLPPEPRNSEQIFVQVAAFSDQAKVIELSEGLARMYQVPTDVPLIDNIYRLRLGPLKNEQKAEKLIQDLKSIGFESAFPLILTAD